MWNQELQLGGRPGDRGHNTGRRSCFPAHPRSSPGGDVTLSRRDGVGAGCGGWVGAPVSRLFLPRQTDKDRSNLWNPGTVEPGVFPTFSVTIHAQLPGLREGNRQDQCPPCLRGVCLEQGLAVDGFLRGGRSAAQEDTGACWATHSVCRLPGARGPCSWLFQSCLCRGGAEGAQWQHRMCSPALPAHLTWGGRGIQHQAAPTAAQGLPSGAVLERAVQRHPGMWL